MKKILTIAAVSAVLLSGCSFLHRNAVITVNGDKITQAEFEQALDKELDNSMFKAFGGSKNFMKSDDNIMYLIYKEKVSKELIIKHLLDSEIAKRGIKVTDEDMKAEMKSIIDKVGSKEELNNLLKQRGVSNGEFNEDLKNQIRVKKLISSIQKVSVSDSDAEKYYKSNTNMFKHEEQVRASHILISSDTLQIIRDLKAKNKNLSPLEINKKLEEIQEAQKAKAEAVFKEVKAHPDQFEAIAKKESDDKVSGERGGELGFFSKTAMVPEFSKAAFAMKPNTISESLVQTSYGYHIIKVTDRIEPGVTPFAKVKDEIKFYLETQEQIKILKNLTDGLMKNAKIEYTDKSFDPANILKQSAAAAEAQKEAQKAAAKEETK